MEVNVYCPRVSVVGPHSATMREARLRNQNHTICQRALYPEWILGRDFSVEVKMLINVAQDFVRVMRGAAGGRGWMAGPLKDGWAAGFRNEVEHKFGPRPLQK